MATTATDKQEPPPRPSALTSVLLRVRFPSSPSSPVQPFERDIQLPPMTTVAALLSYIELYFIPLDPSECLDPHAVHVVWEPGLNWQDKALHDGNVRTEMAKVWMHEGRDTLVVSVTECRRSEGSQQSGGNEGAVGPGSVDNSRQQVEMKRDDLKHQARSPLTRGASESRSSAAASPRQAKPASIEELRHVDLNSSSEGRRSHHTARDEPQTWGGALPTSPVPSSSGSRVGGDWSTGASDSNVSSRMPAGRGGPDKPDSKNNQAWDSSDIDTSGRGAQTSGGRSKPDSGNNDSWGAPDPGADPRGGQSSRGRSKGDSGSDAWDTNDPSAGGREGQTFGGREKPPGFWKADGSWDSEAAANAHGAAAPSYDPPVEPRAAGRGRGGFGNRNTEPLRPAGRGRGGLVISPPEFSSVAGRRASSSHLSTASPSLPATPHLWSDDKLGDRPKDLVDGPPIKQLKSIFPKTAGEKSLSESRWATEGDDVGFGGGRQQRGSTRRGRANYNQERGQRGNQNWGSSAENNSNWEPKTEQGGSGWDSSSQTNANWGPKTEQAGSGWDSTADTGSKWEPSTQTGSGWDSSTHEGSGWDNSAGSNWDTTPQQGASGWESSADQGPKRDSDKKGSGWGSTIQQGSGWDSSADQGSKWDDSAQKGSKWGASSKQEAWDSSADQGYKRDSDKGSGWDSTAQQDSGWDSSAAQGSNWDDSAQQDSSWDRKPQKGSRNPNPVQHQGQPQTWDSSAPQGSNWDPSAKKGSSWDPSPTQADSNWESSANQGSSWDSKPQKGSRNTYPAQHESQPQNWDPAARKPNEQWDTPAQGRGSRNTGWGGEPNSGAEEDPNSKGWESSEAKAPKRGW